VVLESPSQNAGPPLAPHFNAPLSPDAPPQHASQYLEAFGDFEQNGIRLNDYCINHLVTFRPMQQNILGLAYLGSYNPNNIGGVCSPPSMSNHGRQRMIGRNIGMATYANKDGQPILSRQALLVSAHELGHNMGSEHDPVTQSVCSPSWLDGGPYLMYQIAVSGSVRHHSMFSECSSKQIAMLISTRKSSCFHSASNKLCGNHRREPGEECDPGLAEDRCCSADCRLKPPARCSDANSPCCRGCQFAGPGTLCQRKSLLNPCQKDTFCTGLNDTCPRPANEKDGAPCNFGVGYCLLGRWVFVKLLSN
uniref:Peptidase M12B domain-containing protein n=1 Tax=Macrostomum lignano TaxID=282301 RepID=A0A1I8IVU8_9PLAT